MITFRPLSTISTCLPDPDAFRKIKTPEKKRLADKLSYGFGGEWWRYVLD